MQPEEEEEYYTPAELAKAAGCRPQMVYNYMSRNRLQHEYMEYNGRSRYLIRRDVGNEWIKVREERRAPNSR